MKRRPPSPGLPVFIPFDIPTTWTPEQALAIFELVDDLRTTIWDIYGPHLQDEIQAQRQQKARRQPTPRDDPL